MKNINLRFILCALVILSACSLPPQPVNISIVENEPCFYATEGSDETYFLVQLFVSDANGTSTDERTYWTTSVETALQKIKVDTKKTCIAYGKDITGFETKTQPKPLALNTPYQIIISAFTEPSQNDVYMEDRFCLTKENNQLVVKEVVRKEGNGYICSSQNFAVRKAPSRLQRLFGF